MFHKEAYVCMTLHLAVSDSHSFPSLENLPFTADEWSHFHFLLFYQPWKSLKHVKRFCVPNISPVNNILLIVVIRPVQVQAVSLLLWSNICLKPVNFSLISAIQISSIVIHFQLLSNDLLKKTVSSPNNLAASIAYIAGSFISFRLELYWCIESICNWAEY